MKTLALALVATSLANVATAEVTITAPWARASILASRPGAAYLTLQSDTGDRLIGIETPAAQHVMLHRVETDANGVSRMVQVMTLDLPPGESVTLAPGSLHLMLTGLAARLDEGSTLTLILRFETAGVRHIDVPVLGIGAHGPEDGE